MPQPTKPDCSQVEVNLFDYLAANGDEVFTHKDDDGTIRTFLTGAMYRFACRWAGLTPVVVCAETNLTEQAVAHIKKNMGFEQERYDRLCSPYLEMPGVGIFWPDKGDHMFTPVDGNHRAVKLWDMGVRKQKMFIFKHPFWEHFLSPLALGEEALTERSGVIEHEQGLPLSKRRYIP